MNSNFEFNPQKLLDDMVTFVAVLDPSGNIIFVNNTPLQASNITLEEIKGTKFWDAPWWAYSEEAINNIKEDAEYCAKGNTLLHEIQLATADGTLIWIEYGMHPILDDNGHVEYLVPEGRDITEKKQQQMQMQQLAHYDSLTGLPNRVLLTDRFKQAIAHSLRDHSLLAVCFLDLDNFKPVNDRYGHNVGDQLLIKVSQRLTESLRCEDTASRVGGDEFILLLGNLETDKHCESMIERILAILSEPYFIDGDKHLITISCGITIFPSDNDDIDLLVRHADQAMYQAKLSGKSTYHFFDPCVEQITKNHTLFLSQISQAIGNNEFVLFYQPKINLQTGSLIGVEALIRWQHPEKGLLLPNEFLPYIEQTQEMIDLGNWVIHQALTQCEEWIEMGMTTCISINIDAYHLMQEGLIDSLIEHLNNHPKVLPKLLEIEILETIEFTDIKKVSEIIEQCLCLGVRFSLDDFGTGYSSLTYLKNLPVQCLKIDQTFVRDMLTDEQDLALIDGIISLSKAFKREIIAEGVETIEQSNKLIELGCIHAQGYGIAKPMKASEVINWAKHYSVEEAWQQQAV